MTGKNAAILGSAQDTEWLCHIGNEAGKDAGAT